MWIFCCCWNFNFIAKCQTSSHTKQRSSLTQTQPFIIFCKYKSKMWKKCELLTLLPNVKPVHMLNSTAVWHKHTFMDCFATHTLHKDQERQRWVQPEWIKIRISVKTQASPKETQELKTIHPVLPLCHSVSLLIKKKKKQIQGLLSQINGTANPSFHIQSGQ